jgi:cytochrome c oxidase accessory protein FixG
MNNISGTPVEIKPVMLVEESLYEIRKKIYPRAVSGWFAGWRVLMVVLTQLVFYGVVWVQWNGRQAVLFDLVSRKFYIFGIVLWPQDFIYLTVLLVVSALSLFLFTAIAGRLWCGYACPQTVYTEIFLWIERKIEGDRAQRMKLDSQPWSVRKITLKTAKHGAWIALALWTGFTFVGYFTPIQYLASEIATLSLGPWELFWVLFYGLATYGNAGWMREQVCKYMCPYARFQSAMFDSDTMIITYDRDRGEPRGRRSKNADPVSSSLGDCVDCGICVQVCPTGIDIRDGLQYECIGCAACIDSCNQVMKKMNYASGLIRYTTENALEKKWNFQQIARHAIRPRVAVYFLALIAIIVAAGISLATRVPLKVDVIRDRASLSREVEGGDIENIYRLQIMNTLESPMRYEVRVSGVDGARVVGDSFVDLAATSTRMVTVRIRVPSGIQAGSHKISFDIEDTLDSAVSTHENSVFLVR